MDEAQKKSIVSKFEEIAKRQRSIKITADGVTHHGKIEKIHDHWVELQEGQNIFFINISAISAIGYSL